MRFTRDDLLSCQQRLRLDKAADIECRRRVAEGTKRLCLLGALALALGAACGSASKKSDAGDAGPSSSPDSRSGDVIGQGGSTGSAGSSGYDALVDSRIGGSTGMGGALDAAGGTQGAGGTGGAGGAGGSTGGNDTAVGGTDGSVDAREADADSGQGAGGGTTGTNPATGKNDGSAAGGADGGGGGAGPDATSIPPKLDAAQVDSRSGGGGPFHFVLSPSVSGGVRMSSGSYRLVAALTSGMAWATVSTSPRFQLQRGFATKSQ